MKCKLTFIYSLIVIYNISGMTQCTPQGPYIPGIHLIDKKNPIIKNMLGSININSSGTGESSASTYIILNANLHSSLKNIK